MTVVVFGKQHIDTMEFVSFVNDADGNSIYKNTM